MAADQWMEIYRSYTSEELATERTELQKTLKGSLTSQASGTVSGTKDLQEARDRLQALTRVQNERRSRAAGGNGLRGQVSFRGNSWGSL